MNDLTNKDKKPFARTGGMAEVEVVKAEQPSEEIKSLDASVEENNDSSKSTISTILMGVIGLQVMFLAYMLFFVIDDKPSTSVNFRPPAAIQEPLLPTEAKDVLLIQTDGSGNVLQHWEFKKTFVENANRGWLFKTDKSRVFIAPLEHYIFLENPTPEIKQQFLDDKE